MQKNERDTPNAYRNARTCLLDATSALAGHLDSLTLVGGQALHLHTAGKTDFQTPELTFDADLMVDPRVLREPPPTIEFMLDEAHFKPINAAWPGSWHREITVPELATPLSVEMDLLVAESLSGAGSRGARLGGHGKRTARRTPGLDAVFVDRAPMVIRSLAEEDPREVSLLVAGPGALLVAKMFKIRDRLRDGGNRVKDKDAADVLRLLVAVSTQDLASTLKRLRADDRCEKETGEAVTFLRDNGGRTRDPLIRMAQEALRGADDPETVANQFTLLVRSLMEAIEADS